MVEQLRLLTMVSGSNVRWQVSKKKQSALEGGARKVNKCKVYTGPQIVLIYHRNRPIKNEQSSHVQYVINNDGKMSDGKHFPWTKRH